MLRYLIAVCAWIVPFALFAEEGTARKITTDRELSWVTTGAWLGSNEIATIEVANGELLAISTIDGTTRSIAASAKHLGGRKFAKLQQLDSGGLALLDRSGNLTILDKEFLPEEGQLAAKLVEAEDATIRDFRGKRFSSESVSAYSFLVSGTEIYTFSDFMQSNPPWASGFLGTDFLHPREFDMLVNLRLSIGDPIRKFHTLGLPLFASAENGFYTLIMEVRPYIAHVGSSSFRKVVDVSSFCGNRPSIGEYSGELASIRELQDLEESEGPAGIFSHNGSLFVVCRRIGQSKTVEFRLFQIDPFSGGEISMTILPTSQPNIVIIPGSPYWAVLEKSPVQPLRISERVQLPRAPVTSISLIREEAVTARSKLNRLVGSRNTGPIEDESDFVEIIVFLFGGIGVAAISAAIKYRREIWRLTVRLFGRSTEDQVQSGAPD